MRSTVIWGTGSIVAWAICVPLLINIAEDRIVKAVREGTLSEKYLGNEGWTVDYSTVYSDFAFQRRLLELLHQNRTHARFNW